MSKVLDTTRQRVLHEAREIWRNGFVAYDSETTGLEWEDQVIQWAVCSQEGEILGSGYVKPTVPISEGAFEKHGITEEQLTNAPTFAEVWPTLRELLTGRMVVIYNSNFDIGKILSSAQIYGIEVPYNFVKDICAMHLFARFYGEVHEYFGTFVWQKLNEVAIPHLGIEVSGLAHDAEHDAAATAMIIKRLAELADQELPPGWHPPVNVKCAGCGQVVQECAEPDEIWYCRWCSLEKGLFHRCPGCSHIVEAPGKDMCKYCQRRLHQEKMLLIRAWHRCPDDPYHIVETPDLEEPCAACLRQREWKRNREEAERERQTKLEQERKERRRVYACEYRQRRKEREQENLRRAELGLPLRDQPSKPTREAVFPHNGHQFQRQKDQYGRPEVYCLKCEVVWSKLPQCLCAGIKAYRSWTSIPAHLKTRTQLLKEHLKPAKGQKPQAVMEGYFDRYNLYNKSECVLVERRMREK